MKQVFGGKLAVPLSPAIATEDYVFVSGMVPDNLDGDVKQQTREVLTKVKNLLEQAGSSMDKVVKTTVFLTDMADFPAMNEVYAEFFPNDPPARSTVGVALAIDAKVEIEAIALRK